MLFFGVVSAQTEKVVEFFLGEAAEAHVFRSGRPKNSEPHSQHSSLAGAASPVGESRAYAIQRSSRLADDTRKSR